MNLYCLNVTSAKGNEVAMPPCVRSDNGYVHVVVKNLVGTTSYNFSIISSNNIDQQSTSEISFCKEIKS